MKPNEYRKAIVGGLLAALTSLATAMANEGVSPVEWIGVAIAALATFGSVFGVSNIDPLQGRRKREGGQSNVLYILACTLLAVLLVWTVATVVESIAVK